MKSPRNVFIAIIATLTSASSLLAAPDVTIYNDTIDAEKSHVINQREYSYAYCEDHVASISTHSIAGCFFVVVYDPAKKFGVAVHWDDDTQRESFRRIRKFLEHRGSTPSTLQATVVGGWDARQYFYSKLTGNFLLKELKDWGVTMFFTDHMYEKAPGSNLVSLPIATLRKSRFFTLAFDFCEGKLLLSDEKKPPETDEDTVLRIMDCAENNPLYEGVPNSGCPIKFVAPVEKVREEL
jgi:hypothetical protein